MAFDPLYPTVHHFDSDLNEDTILWKLASSVYLKLGELLQLIPQRDKLRKLLKDDTVYQRVTKAKGSSHNHQAWTGGYLDHIVETMNIACQLFETMNYLRPLPFKMEDALIVMFLHDLEKPWKENLTVINDFGDEINGQVVFRSKQERRDFRDAVIAQFGIELTDDHKNALRYVEGIPDSEYVPGARIMGELAAFCHCCDIISARLWHDKGRDQEEWE